MQSAAPLDAMAVASELAVRANLEKPLSLSRLTGGRNNQAFRVSFQNQQDVVLKLYHFDENDRRDRLNAEWNFLSYVFNRGVHSVPEPIVKDDNEHAALIGFVHGKKRQGHLNKTDIDHATDFVAMINKEPRDVMALQPGSEACFSLAAHVETIAQRVDRLALIDKDGPLADQASRLIEHEIIPAWSKVRRGIDQQSKDSGVNFGQEIATADMCVSPSDFGFHNALIDDEGVTTFIDFEYAGRDDPAKLICDFLCQPEIPIPQNYASYALDRLSVTLGLDASRRATAEMMIPAYQIKWICIMLNEFMPLDSGRRAFAELNNHGDHRAAQLKKVCFALKQISI